MHEEKKDKKEEDKDPDFKEFKIKLLHRVLGFLFLEFGHLATLNFLEKMSIFGN